MHTIAQTNYITFLKEGDKVFASRKMGEPERVLLRDTYNMDGKKAKVFTEEGIEYLSPSIIATLHKALTMEAPTFLWDDYAMTIEDYFILLEHRHYGKYEFSVNEDGEIEAYYSSQDIYLEGFDLSPGLKIFSASFSPLKFEVHCFNSIVPLTLASNKILSISLLISKGVYN